MTGYVNEKLGSLCVRSVSGYERECSSLSRLIKSKEVER